MTQYANSAEKANSSRLDQCSVHFLPYTQRFYLLVKLLPRLFCRLPPHSLNLQQQSIGRQFAYGSQGVCLFICSAKCNPQLIYFEILNQLESYPRCRCLASQKIVKTISAFTLAIYCGIFKASKT